MQELSRSVSNWAEGANLAPPPPTRWLATPLTLDPVDTMRTITRLLVTITALAALVAAGVGVVRSPAEADHAGGIDEELDCLEPVPAHLSLASSPSRTLRVQVVLDGTTTARRDAVLAAADATFSARGVRLAVAGTDVVDLAGTDARGLIDQAKARYGGRVPSGADIVVVLSGADLTGPAGQATAGLADCIGGARFERHGFAVAEVRSAARGGIVTAHEIGHLLGAQHHYASCAEQGGATVGVHVGVPPCTVMINDVNLARPEMSQITGRVVRGHAERL